MARRPRLRHAAAPAPAPAPATASLRSLEDARRFVRDNEGLRGLEVEVLAADGVEAASEMAKMLRQCFDEREWKVKDLAFLEEAAAVEEPLSAASLSVATLVSKLKGELIARAAQEEEGAGRGQRARTSGRMVHQQLGVHGIHDQGALRVRGYGAPLHGRGAHAHAHGVALADGTGVSSTRNAIKRLRAAGKKIQKTNSVPLQERAKLLADEMEETRLALNQFACSFQSLDADWGKSSKRLSRAVCKAKFLKRVSGLDKQREAVLERLEALDLHFVRFGSEGIEFELL